MRVAQKPERERGCNLSQKPERERGCGVCTLPNGRVSVFLRAQDEAITGLKPHLKHHNIHAARKLSDDVLLLVFP